MSDTSYKEIAKLGLWGNNAGLVQLLGLCPLLAISATVVNGIGLGIMTTLTLILSNTIISALRRFLLQEIRIPIFVMVIAFVVTSIELLSRAFFYDLYNVLGIFIPLIVTNCVIIGRAEAFASKQPVLKASADGLFMGLGFTLLLIVIGGIREILGAGTLFKNAHLLFGDAGQAMTITLYEDFPGLLLAVLPPGAFFALGLLIAVKNMLDNRAQQRVKNNAQAIDISRLETPQ